MNQKTETTETAKTTETLETLEERPETDEPIICPTCNKEQLKIINVKICEAKDSLWYKCSISKKCPLFQIKITN